MRAMPSRHRHPKLALGLAATSTRALPHGAASLLGGMRGRPEPER